MHINDHTRLMITDQGHIKLDLVVTVHTYSFRVYAQWQVLILVFTHCAHFGESKGDLIVTD